MAQITDIHVGHNNINGPTARHHLQWALQEMAALHPRPAAVLVTADLVCAGKREELEEYARLVAESDLPRYALPANHDLWGEDDSAAWEQLVGPVRQTVDFPGLRVVLWDDLRRQEGRNFRPQADAETLQWLDGELSGGPEACLVAHHVPMLPLGDGFHDGWPAKEARAALEIMASRKVLAAVTGHWHRNGEWEAFGVRVINTGALCGWQWTGTPPHYSFPTRAGYRLLAYDGILRSFWRDGSYWDMPGPWPQVTLAFVGPAHTGGPRPQAHTIEVSGPCTLRAQTFTLDDSVETVEWSVAHGQWVPMERTYQGVWNDWEAQLDPQRIRTSQDVVLCVRARTASGREAFDQVPLSIGERDCSARVQQPAIARAEKLFELWYKPE
jgi:3',5'-cyclic AMP phosphodiesterase CpdA